MLEAASVGSAVGDAIRRAATTLRPDVREAIAVACASESSERGKAVLRMLLENAEIAERDGVPLCQDTGTVRVHLEIGSEEGVAGDLAAAVDEAVATAYRENALRMSVARDAILDRTNTGDNTPAFLDVTLRPGRGATVHVMLKGGGSDNASVVAMLDPAEGVAGVSRVVLETVEAKATGACPPLVIGIGVGATFDGVARLATRALMRPLGPSRDPRVAAFEAELLEAVNATGIGPAGLGGTTTALGVHVETAPCHIAALPVAVNLGCCAMRSASVEVP